jgi:two-component system, NarL family, response regulator DegU
MSTIRVLIADNLASVRRDVRSILQGHAGLEIVGEAENGTEAIGAARTLRPDLIIMDWKMPVLDGLSAAQIIKERIPETVILMFSRHKDPQFIELAKNVGLNGFVAKEAGAQALLNAIYAVMQGKKHFPALTAHG